MSYRKDEEKERVSSIRCTIKTIDKLRMLEYSKKETSEEIINRLMGFAFTFKKNFDKFCMNNIQKMKGGQ